MIVGGARDRLIHDSLYHMVKDSLTDLGWFDSGRKHRPVTIVAEPVEEDTKLQPNIVSVSDEATIMEEVEMGRGDLKEYRWEYWIDVYGESLPVAKHLAGDIRTILEGKFNSIGRSRPNVTIYDWSMATPMEVFSCEIENVEYDRSRFYNKPFQKHWYMIRFEVVDVYGDEDSE
jgi:hypothetical protein